MANFDTIICVKCKGYHFRISVSFRDIFFFVFFQKVLKQGPWMTDIPTRRHLSVISKKKKTHVLKEYIFPCLRQLRPMVMFTFVLSLEYTKLETMTFKGLKRSLPDVEDRVFCVWGLGIWFQFICISFLFCIVFICFFFLSFYLIFFYHLF